MTYSGSKLASWILKNSEGVTHLKLQKLSFYCWAIALAEGHDDQVGRIHFEPWEHGPVCREIWHEYKTYGSGVIPPGDESCGTYSPEVERLFSAVISIYGRLTAWSLRQQSHLEDPWIRAWEGKHGSLDGEFVREHFRRKFLGGAVKPPEYLMDLGSFTIDGLPTRLHQDIYELSEWLNNFQ